MTGQRYRGARLPDAARARTARRSQILATGMLASGLLALVAFGIQVAPIAEIGVVLGALAWLAIPFWMLTLGRSPNPARRDASTKPTPPRDAGLCLPGRADWLPSAAARPRPTA